jgi:hypothetical protein
LVLTHAEKANVEVAIGRIREQLEAQAFRFGDASLRVTASFGVSGSGRIASRFCRFS